MFKDFFRIDKSYWLLVPMILQATIPWLQFRIRIWYVFAFVIVWLACNFGQIVTSIGSRASSTARWFILWYLLFNTISYIYALFGYGDYMGWGKVSMFTNQLVFFIAVHCTLERRKFREFRFLAYFVMLGLCIAGFMAFRGIGDEGIEGARLLVGRSRIESGSKAFDGLVESVDLGLGDYRFVYMCAWFFPLFLMTMSLVKKKAVKFSMVMLASLMVVCVKTGGLGTAMLVLVIAFCMYCLWRMRCNTRIPLKVVGWSLVIMFFLYATVPTVFGFISSPIRALAETMAEGSVRNRIESIADSFSGYTYGNYAYGRAQLQLASLRGFLDKPIFGNGMYIGDLFGERGDIIGGHSMILDHLAYYGLFGFVPLLLMLITFGRYNFWIARTYFGHKWMAMPTVFLILFIFSSLANPTFGIPHMAFILIPGLGYVVALANKEPIGMPPGMPPPPYCN